MSSEIKNTINSWIRFGDKMTKKELLSFSGSDCNNHENLKYMIVFISNYKQTSDGFSGIFELAIQYQSKYDYNTYEQLCFDAIKEMDVEGKSDYEKAYALCTWVHKRIKSKGNGAQSGMNGMINQAGVCNAYAELSCYLGRCLGLDILYESGDVWIDTHAWNLVKVDNEWYYMDATHPTDQTNGLLQGNDWLKCNVEKVDDEFKNYKEIYKISDESYLNKHSKCNGKHNWIEGGSGSVTENIGDSTCTDPYIAAFHCKTCGAYKWEYYKDPKGHTEGELVRIDEEATCTKTGLELVHCTTCGKNYYKTIPMLPHNYVNGKCTMCHATCAHDYGEWETTLAPSCSNGERKRTCKICGFVNTQTIPATHDFQWVYVQNPTCTNVGKKQLKCSVCKKTKGNLERVEPLGHDFQTTKTIPATCRTKAKENQKCSRCPVTQTLTIEDSHYADHTWTTGNGTVKCSVCGATHTHRWEEDTALAKSPTCTEPGEKHYVCTADYKDFDQEVHKCTSTKTETLPALGHKWENGKCTVCGATHEHDWKENTALAQEPTCTKEGKKVYTCTICNEQYEETIPKAEHKWTTVKVTASSTRCKCTVCGTTKAHNKELTGHDEATCTTSAYNRYKCTDCGHAYRVVDKDNPALGHDWSNESGKCTRCNAEHTHEFTEEVTLAPTCSKEGKKTLTCKTCGWEKSEPISATEEHQWGDWETTLAPTCTKEGEKARTCEVCNKTETETIKATGHTPEKQADVPATCTKDGKEGDTICSICHETLKTGAVIPATGKHDWKETITKQPTCNSTGTKVLTCKTCGTTETEELQKTDTHDWKETLTQSPTCTEEGKKIFTCQTCGKTKTETLKATGHTPEKQADISATCIKDGKEGDTVCSTCHKTIKTGAVLKATDHSWDSGKITLAPTYTKTGTKTFTCKKCGEKQSQTIPKLALPATSTKLSVGGNKYVITKAGAEVSFSQANSKAKSITIPNTVSVDGITYKVVGIKANAFKNCKKLTTVTIGSNVKSIATKAFNNCPKLKKVTIKTVLLSKKTANQKAFNKVNKKVILKVPAKAKKSYKSIFKGLIVK